MTHTWQRIRWSASLLAIVLVPGLWAALARSQADEPKFDAPAIAFFEKEVQPILESNCYKCHGEGPKLKGGLNLTHRSVILKGGELGAVVDLAKPAESLLLKAINYNEEKLRMPPRSKLSQREIDVLTKWVGMGLPWTPGQKPNEVAHTEEPEHRNNEINEHTRNHWSFRPIVQPEVPAFAGANNAAWVRTPIDAFILTRLQTAGIKPAPRADKVTLIRRAYYDLIGLPPTPEQVQTFLNDKSPDAYERVVDELLQSPHYGEKWGRHWLDLVHYAESNSFERDNPKPEVWRYRDYVIRAFNEDKPFTQFVREQLAGDELDRVTPDSIIATGYYRLGLWDDESADPPKSRYDEMDDWVTITAQTFLGLTMNCARCHEHKIDPLPQEDYYRFLAFFRDIRSFQGGADGMNKGFAEGNWLRKLTDFMSPEELTQYASSINVDAARLQQLDDELSRMDDEIIKKLPGGVNDDFKYESNRLTIVKKYAGDLITKPMARKYETLFKQRAEQRKAQATSDVRVLCVNALPNPPVTHVQIRGNPGADGREVKPGFPQVLGFEDPQIPEPIAGQHSAGRRRILADWLVSDKNPLTARVIVNRVWQHHFGRGLVRTANDFGMQGDRPTHPELLDWLAAELMRTGWHFKALHKLIMMSSTYQLSGEFSADSDAKDARNDLFWRYNIRRLTAEEVRDSILAANGRLNLKLFGESIYPPIPAEVLAGQSRPGANWNTSGEPDRYRRSVYIHIKRSLLVPIMEDFDAADTDNTCPVRFVTTQPTQALGMLNSAFLNEQAAAFAQRVKTEAGEAARDRVALALRLATQRDPSDADIARGVKLIESFKNEDKMSEDDAMKYYCLLVLNLNEFMYVD